MNVFKKCLREEFGKNRYLHYVRICEEEMEQKEEKPSKLEDKEIYKDMYEILHRKSEEYIDERVQSLTDVLFTAVQIGKKFGAVLAFYIAANILLLALGLDYYVTCISLALMGVCFIYKLIEFLSNKYCFIDAYLIMIYKSVLEKLAGHSVGE